MRCEVRVVDPHTVEELRAELVKVGAEPSSLDEAVARSTLRLVRLDGISLAEARLLYQELTMEGGLVVTAPRLEHFGAKPIAAVLCGTRYQLEHLCVRLRWQSSDELQLLAQAIGDALSRFDRPYDSQMTIGPATFRWGERTYIMGVLNVTPDSFSGDGLIEPGDSTSATVARAVARAETLMAEGADILDIGGESTHPHANPIDAETESRRVLPVIEGVAQRVRAPISIDTYKGSVARQALAAGAHMVNDVSGLASDSELKSVLAELRAPVVINHSWLGEEPSARHVTDVTRAIIRDLCSKIEAALEAGIQFGNIIIDPGLGFGKSTEQNLEILDRLKEFGTLGFPIMIGPSRKGFISRAIDVPADEREEGTAAAVALGIARGADLIRVHDVKSMARVAHMADAIIRRKSSPVTIINAER